MNKLRNKLMGILLLILPLYFFSCSDDENDDPKVLLPKTEGFYVFGEKTVAADPSEPAARMALALLDPTKAPLTTSLDSVYGKYIYIGAGGKISFAVVPKDEDGVLLGSNDAVTENGVEHNSVDDNIIHGTIQEGGDAIEVAEEGLYYVFVDMNNLTFVITRVEGQVIGDALIDLAWSAGTVLTQKSTSLTQTVFEATNVKMQIGGYKYRFNEGWHSYTDANMSTFSFLGELDYDIAWDAQEANPGFFNSNIPCFALGLYTINLTFSTNLATGGEGVWTASVVKTGEILVDYSASQVAIIGDATEGGCFCGDGTGGYGQKAPTKNGDVYTWAWNDVPMIEAKQFIFLQNATWGAGLQIDYTGATVSGSAIDSGDIIDATADPVNDLYHNFYVVTAGTYDITLVVDAATNVRTVTINNN